MARNKYPEETVARILDAAQRLFLEKGYDQTTIQDIVDQLGGLTKGAVYHHFKSKEEILDASIPITRNPRILVEMIESNRRILTPYYLELLEEGNRDGSLHTDYPRELAELIPLLTSLWLLPSVFPATKAQARRKFDFLADMLARMGVPLVDDETRRLIDEFFARIPDGVYADEPVGP